MSMTQFRTKPSNRTVNLENYKHPAFQKWTKHYLEQANINAMQSDYFPHPCLARNPSYTHMTRTPDTLLHKATITISAGKIKNDPNYGINKQKNTTSKSTQIIVYGIPS